MNDPEMTPESGEAGAGPDEGETATGTDLTDQDGATISVVLDPDGLTETVTDGYDPTNLVVIREPSTPDQCAGYPAPVTSWDDDVRPLQAWLGVVVSGVYDMRTKQEVQRIQRALRHDGLFEGPIDGLWNEATRSAACALGQLPGR